MVKLTSLALAGVLALVIGGSLFLRREIGEAGQLLGQGFAGFGSGLGQGLSGLGRGFANIGLGTQMAISSLFSPRIAPSFTPTIGLNVALPDFPEFKWPDLTSLFGGNQPTKEKTKTNPVPVAPAFSGIGGIGPSDVNPFTGGLSTEAQAEITAEWEAFRGSTGLGI